MSQEFRLENLDETRNCFSEEIEQNELMSRKHKKDCTTLNYTEHFLILACAVTRCILLGIPIGIKSSAIGLKIRTIAGGIKMCKSIIKKKKKTHGKIVLLEKSKLNSKEVLISKVLSDSNISNDEFFLMNNVLKEYDKMREEIKKIKDLNKQFIEDFSLFIKQCCRIV